VDAVSSSFSLPIIGRRAKELSTSSAGVEDDDGGIIYARSSQQRRRQYTRGKSKKSILECPLYCNHECRCARLCVCNFFRIQEKNVSLIRALELISLSLCVCLSVVRFCPLLLPPKAIKNFGVGNSYTLNIFLFALSTTNQQKSDKKAPNARASGIIIICIVVVINRTLINHESKI